MSESKYWGGDIPWVSSGEMTQRKIYDTSSRVTEAGAKEGSRLVPARTILAVVRGMSLAKEFRVAITAREVAFNQDLKALVPSERLLPEFLFYYLLSQNQPIKDSASESGHGTKKLDTQVLEEWPLPLPSMDVQKKIAAVLSAYDELIELNRRRIGLLEKLAEELYREWFVRLRFPGHEKTKIVKGVPQGWTRDAISSFTTTLRRGVAPVYANDGDGIAINQKCIRGGKVSLLEARRQSRDVSESRYVQVGDVLVNSTGEGTLGRVAQVLTPIDRAIVDSHVTIVRAKPEVPSHYFGMTLRKWEPHLSIMGQGSTNQTELSPSAIGRLSILMPPDGISRRFEEIVSPVFAESELLGRQNEALTRTRDLLLPRLISGKLRVEDLDIQFPPGMSDCESRTS